MDQPGFDWLAGPGNAVRVTAYGYDGAGRQISVTDPSGHVTQTDYNPAGRVSAVTTPEGRVTTMGYDAAGHPTTVTTASPAGTGTVSTTTAYTAAGLVASTTDPHVVVTGQDDPSTRAFDYTAGGRVHEVTDALGNTVTYGYDERGNRTSRSALDDTATAQVESWTYDLGDRVVAHTVPPSTPGSDPATTTYTYDPAHGWLTGVTDPTGRVESRTHYADGAVLASTWTKSGADTISQTHWRNGRGWETKARAMTGTVGGDTAYTFDRAGQVLTMAGPTGDGLSWKWDQVGLVREMTRPDGSKLRYSHDPTGSLDGIETAPTGGAFGGLATYTYDQDGLLVSETLAASPGASRHWGYNTAGAVTSYQQVTRRTDGSTDTYDAVMAWRPDGRLSVETINNALPTLYDYDAAGQLTTQTGTILRTWAYGTRANLTESSNDGAITTYTTNPNATMATATTGTSAVTYTYDELGRRTQARTTVAGSETRRLDTVYDSAGRLNALVNNGSGGNTLELRTYDSDNHVSTSVVHDGATTTTTNQLWDHTSGVPQVVADSTDAGTTWATTTFGPAGLIATTTPTGDTTWYQTDPRGSVIELPANPDIVDGPTNYTPTGQPATPPPDPTGATRRGYRGEQTATGLIHLRNRDYDPTTGQFLTPDPLDGMDGTPTVANPYHYADNDPLNKVDPLGLRPNDQTLVPVVPPASLRDGALCSPPLTRDLQPIVYNSSRRSCGVWSSNGVVCAHGGTVQYVNVIVNPICQHAEGINQGLAVIAALAIATAVVAALPVIAGPLATTCSADPGECEAVSAEANAELDALSAFHHTTDEAVANILQEGLWEGTYATPSQLSPMQAHIELALNPLGGARNAVLEIVLAGLRDAGYEIPAATRVAGAFGMPGGGYEIRFPFEIPPEFIKVIQ